MDIKIVYLLSSLILAYLAVGSGIILYIVFLIDRRPKGLGLMLSLLFFWPFLSKGKEWEKDFFE